MTSVASATVAHVLQGLRHLKIQQSPYVSLYLILILIAVTITPVTKEKPTIVPYNYSDSSP
jgi:hypothetical protein